MTNIQVSVSADERHRLETCAVEPIRVPGAIQAHGALLSVDLQSFDVLQASANCGDVLGVAADALKGSALVDLIGADAVEQCRDLLERRGGTTNPVAVQIDGKHFDAVVHGVDGLGIVEFEPATEDGPSVATVHAAIHRLSEARTVTDIYADTAREMRRLTQFDRVLVYKFHADGHGEVVAEEVAAGMEPYMGLHFPASDIPAQARQLYLSKLCRFILLGDQPPAELVPAEHPLTGQPVDLGHAELRSVSPHHVEFMRNMGQATTLSLSLIHRDQLIGMVTCAHRSPRRISYAIREAYTVLARQVSMQLGTVAEIQRLTRLDSVRAIRALLARQMESGDDIGGALLGGKVTLLDLVPADGVTLHLGKVTMSIADAPDTVIGPEMLADIGGAHGSVVVTDSVGEDYPRLQELMPGIAGVLIVPIGGEGDYLAWFRKETISTVRWLGDQSLANRNTPFTPRNSFAMWSESVAGKSEPWDDLALLEALEIRHDLNAVLLRVAESQLARAALHDPLTGLPNRRLLSDRMDQALAKLERGVPVALLFADLDGFKVINDSQGHGVGDGVIVAAAHRIREVMRGQDTVARIGGDEFVVLCEGAGAKEAEIAAERIVEAFLAPIEAGSGQYRVSVSVGIALAERGQSPEAVLRAADMAMYRAKHGGRSRASY